jgi:hypothetical protein
MDGARGMSKPKTNNRRTETVKRHRGKTVPLARSGAAMIQEERFEGGVMRSQQREEKGIDQGDNGEEFETIVPRPEAGAFEGEFGFEKAEGGLNLPTAGIGKENLPSILSRGNGQIREEMPRRMPFWTTNHEPKGLRILGVMHWEVEDSNLALATASCIPEQAIFT